jgi:hypothetical protein
MKHSDELKLNDIVKELMDSTDVVQGYVTLQLFDEVTGKMINEVKQTNYISRAMEIYFLSRLAGYKDSDINYFFRKEFGTTAARSTISGETIHSSAEITLLKLTKSMTEINDKNKEYRIHGDPINSDFTINPTESLKTADQIKRVWDFRTDQGNGTFNTMWMGLSGSTDPWLTLNFEMDFGPDFIVSDLNTTISSGYNFQFLLYREDDGTSRYFFEYGGAANTLDRYVFEGTLDYIDYKMKMTFLRKITLPNSNSGRLIGFNIVKNAMGQLLLVNREMTSTALNITYSVYNLNNPAGDYTKLGNTFSASTTIYDYYFDCSIGTKLYQLVWKVDVNSARNLGVQVVDFSDTSTTELKELDFVYLQNDAKYSNTSSYNIVWEKEFNRLLVTLDDNVNSIKYFDIAFDQQTGNLLDVKEFSKTNKYSLWNDRKIHDGTTYSYSSLPKTFSKTKQIGFFSKILLPNDVTKTSVNTMKITYTLNRTGYLADLIKNYMI